MFAGIICSDLLCACPVYSHATGNLLHFRDDRNSKAFLASFSFVCRCNCRPKPSKIVSRFGRDLRSIGVTTIASIASGTGWRRPGSRCTRWRSPRSQAPRPGRTSARPSAVPARWRQRGPARPFPAHSTRPHRRYSCSTPSFRPPKLAGSTPLDNVDYTTQTTASQAQNKKIFAPQTVDTKGLATSQQNNFYEHKHGARGRANRY